MQVNVKNIVSISEANQNFSKVARLVDKDGAAIILKNNTPKYILIDFHKFQAEELAKDDDVKAIASRFLAKHKAAFMELAK